jgi:hypothetical protein
MGGAFIAGGCGLIAFAWHDYQPARESLHWTRVPAEIEQAVYQDAYRQRHHPDEPDYLLSYRYSVGKHTYHSGRIRFGGTTGSESQAVIARYRQGDRVEVWVDPLDPSNAVLYPGPSSGSLVPIVFGAGLIAIGVLISVRMYRDRN